MKISTSPESQAKARETPAFNIIFKGLNKCNAGCTFCSVGDTQGKIISWQDFKRLADEIEAFLAEQGIERLVFTFHGGEPTLLGADLIDRICRRLRAMAITVTFNMQSNLLAVPSELREVIRKYDIKLGTSIDPLGQERLTREGKNAFFPWLKTYLELAEEMVAPGAIYVVTKHSLGKAAQLYDICESLGCLTGQRFSLQVNPVYSQGRAAADRNNIAITPEEFGDFMIDIWRLWEENGRSISITPLQTFAEFFMVGDPNRRFNLPCAFTGTCSDSHLGIDFDLNVASCGRRLDSGIFLGNLRQKKLGQIVRDHWERSELSARTASLSMTQCRDCHFFNLCHGGCPDDAWLESGKLTAPFKWCESYRKFFQTLEKEVRQRRQPAIPPPSRPKGDAEQVAIYPLTDFARQPTCLSKNSEIWMLPDPTGKWLKFDSSLGKALHSGPIRIRLWCYNHQVNSLMMWNDLLKKKGVAVALFEAEGLAAAMNVLNSLGALIILDIEAITHGMRDFDELNAIFERFTGDPLWHSQVLPFSQMISHKIKKGGILLHDSFGLVPGHFRSVGVADDDALSQQARVILTRLTTLAGTSAYDWLTDRRACLDCRWYRFCGARFAPGDGSPCSPFLQTVVERMEATALKLSSLL